MLCTLFAAPSEAALVDCLNLKILRVTSESVREDAFVFQNKLVVEVSDQNGNQTMCGGGMYLYLPATDSNYNRIMALATTALITGRSVTLAVNNSAANTLNLGFGTAVLLAFVTLQ